MAKSPVLNWTEAPLRQRLRGFGHLLGGLLLVGAAIAWALSLPALPALWVRVLGKKPQALDGWGLDDLLQQYPQLVAYAFVLGAALWFGLRPALQTVAPPPQIWRWWQNALLRYLPIGALGAILGLATYLRAIVPLTLDAGTMVATDYDEGLLAEAALLVTKGETLYSDVFFNQPPSAAFIWSLPLRFGHSAWGNADDLLRMRLWMTILSLITIVLVYIIGRRLAGPMAGLLAALVLTVDSQAQKFDQRLIFEPLINLGLAAALLAFLYDAPEAKGRRRWLPLLLAGLFVGLTITVKIPAVVGVAALIVPLLVNRRWRDSAVVGAGVLVGFVPINLYYFIATGSNFIKQVYVSRIIEPVNTFDLTQHTTDTRFFDFLYRTPSVQITTIGAALGLLVIVGRWLRDREADRWLSVVLVAILTVYLYAGKGGWSRHYYSQIIFPMALLAGGLMVAWPKRWRLRRWWGIVAAYMIAGGVLAWLSLPYVNIAAKTTVGGGDHPLLAAKAMNDFDLSNEGALWSWDSSYAFITGHPLPRGNDGLINIDNNGYTIYMAFGLEKDGTMEALSKIVNKPTNLPKPLVNAPNFQGALRYYLDECRYIFIEVDQKSRFDDINTDLLNRRYALRTSNNDVAIYERIGHLAQGLTDGDVTYIGYDGANEADVKEPLDLQIYWRTPKLDGSIAVVTLTDTQGRVVAHSQTRVPEEGSKSTNRKVSGTLYDKQTLVPPAGTLPGTYQLRADFYVPKSNEARADIINPAVLHVEMGTVTFK